MKSLIGITCTERPLTPVEGHESTMVGVRDSYIQAIADAGGIPVLIPPGPTEDILAGMTPRLDGLLLSGGADVDPRYYGEAPHPCLGQVEPPRDELELALARWALTQDVPLLGICRGHQVLNVAASGSLYQDLPTQLPGALRHATDLAHPRDTRVHPVHTVPGTRLRDILGDGLLDVNSWHHQAVKGVAPGLVVAAWAPDGVVEGLESPRHRFIVGVQFHPEDLYRDDQRMWRLFRALVEACQ